jgi:hypothetical protein
MQHYQALPATGDPKQGYVNNLKVPLHFRRGNEPNKRDGTKRVNTID